MQTLLPAWLQTPSSQEEIERICMRNLLASSEERIFFKDRESRFLFVSAGWLAAYQPGRALADVIGKTDFDIFSDAHATEAFEDEQRIIATGRPQVAKVQRETFRDRPDAWTSTTKLPLLDESGEIIGTFGLSRDISVLGRSAGGAHVSGAARHHHRTGEPGGADGSSPPSARRPRGTSRPAGAAVRRSRRLQERQRHAGTRHRDRVLREVGRRLTAISRRGDTVARLGGDEFVLLCTALREDDDLDVICDRAMTAICAPLRDGAHDLTVTGSVGVVLTAQPAAEPEELLRQADIAMSAAKRSGGNRFEIYTPELRSLAKSSRGLAAELRQAIEDSELFVVYQPVFDLQDGVDAGRRDARPLAPR